MLELLGMRWTSSLPSLPGPLWPRVVVHDMSLSMGQIKVRLLHWVQAKGSTDLQEIELFIHLTIWIQMTDF